MKHKIRLKKYLKELKAFRRSPLVCAASGCEGCLVCEPEKFTEEQRQQFKLQRFGLIDNE